MSRAGIRLGIDLGGSKISGVALDAAGVVVAHERMPSPRDDYQASLDAVAGMVDVLCRAAGADPRTVRIGLGTPGSWLPEAGIMQNCNSTWLNGRPLLADLQRRFGASGSGRSRVRIANDADCFALSEARDGAGADSRAAAVPAGASDVPLDAAGSAISPDPAGQRRRRGVFGVILGTGVGGGLVLDGALHGGPQGLAGEWGHTPLPYLRRPIFAANVRAPAHEARRIQLESRLADRPCYCGRLNCVETFLSGPGLAQSHQVLWGACRTPEALARCDDDEARTTLDLYAHMLARSLAQVINVIDPDVIVLGGGLSNVEALYPRVSELLPAFVFGAAGGSSAPPLRTLLRRARWGDDSGVRGAAWLWNVA
ncbi:MAG: ROK family protein [Pseudomonadales bacterium]